MRRTGVVFVAVVLGLLAGCGVDPQSEPKALTADDVPFDLLQPAAPRSSSADEQGGAIHVFLVRDGRLVATPRGREAADSPRSLLATLLEGPTGEEASAGLSTSIPPELGVDRTIIRGDTAFVDLAGPLDVIAARPDRSLAIAQLVYTATDLPGVSLVAFRLGGERAEVPRGDGTLTNEPVSRSDFPMTVAR
jgi:Sporulation and spore germination